MNLDKTKYNSHALTEVMNVENRNEWILVTRYRIGKYTYEQYNDVRLDNK